MGRLATLLAGLLLSRTGRGMAGRHAGKLALATLAFQLWQQRRQERASPPPRAASRGRWSRRRP